MWTMLDSAQFRFFAIAAGVLTLTNFLVMNDYAGLWSGPEAAIAWGGTNEGLAPLLLAWRYHMLWETAEGNLFLFRLPSVLWMGIATAVFYILAKPLFSRRTTILAMLVAAGSIGLPQLAKLATPDSCLLALHTLGFLLMLRFMKQPSPRWRFAFYGAVLAGGLIHPWATFILFAFGPVFLFQIKEWRKQFWSLHPWIPALLVLGLGRLLGYDMWRPPYFVSGLYHEPYLFVVLGGFLPFTGFVLSGFRDYLPKLRRGDEMAQILIMWCLGGLLAGSPVAAIPVAVVVARQMEAYFHPNYPFSNWVKTGAVLHLIAAFFGAMALMMGGLHYFSGPGFRAGMAVSAVYWSMSFLGVVGLFGMQRRLVIGGPVLAGMLGILVFWLQAYPLWESRRKAEIKIVDSIPAGYGDTVYVIHRHTRDFPNLAVYARRQFPGATVKAAFHLSAGQIKGAGANYVIAPKGWKGLPGDCRALESAAEVTSGTDTEVWICGAVRLEN